VLDDELVGSLGKAAIGHSVVELYPLPSDKSRGVRYTSPSMHLSAPAESATARAVIFTLSALALIAVLVTLYAFPPRAPAGSPGMLPTLNAVLNGAAATFLVTGYVFIRRRNVPAHRACMLGAFGLSTAFFVSYMLHHAQVGSVPFQGSGAVRLAYFALLIPHVVLAAGVVPLALFTIYRGWTARIEAHRKIARITLPIWLFVSVSGVLVYVMLYHLPV
jgi:putative membrane protein